MSPLKSSNILTQHTLNTSFTLDITNKYKTIYNNSYLLLTALLNLVLLKSSILNSYSSRNIFDTKALQYAFSHSITNTIQHSANNKTFYNNLIPDTSLNKTVSKVVINSFKNNFFQENIIS